ncbi:MAG: hypothetical protein KC994_12095, partial [Candidatus Omnitrophica bacterium]|nr:hypothetical protein [Candidatus Omnitrophota bacterium]
MAKTGDENLTPMMRQYRSIKETCGDAILMFRSGDVRKGLGDFYEMFEEDAKVAARVLKSRAWFT